jgi:hypothetical protein
LDSTTLILSCRLWQLDQGSSNKHRFPRIPSQSTFSISEFKIRGRLTDAALSLPGFRPYQSKKKINMKSNIFVLLNTKRLFSSKLWHKIKKAFRQISTKRLEEPKMKKLKITVLFLKEFKNEK